MTPHPGLSKLQRSVLLTALRNRGPRQDDPRPAEATYAEVLAAHWGPVPVSDGARDARGLGAGPRRSAATTARRDAARASLSRAVSRLVQRGLVTRSDRVLGRGAGVRLTAAGVEAARRLLDGPRGRPTVASRLRDELREARERARAELDDALAAATSLRDSLRVARAELDDAGRQLRERREEVAALRAESDGRLMDLIAMGAEVVRLRRELEDHEARRRRYDEYARQWEEILRSFAATHATGAGVVPPSVAEALGVLGLSHPCSLADVKVAYRRAVMRCHPDRGGSNAEAARVNAAYEVLERHFGRA